MKEMSRRQKEVYDFIKDYHTQQGISPSVNDIAEGLGLAHTTITIYVDVLKKKGFVKNLVGIPRSLTVVEEPEQVVATIAAGA
jgi:repressor LexA